MLGSGKFQVSELGNPQFMEELGFTGKIGAKHLKQNTKK